jgi:hypothetical protein
VYVNREIQKQITHIHTYIKNNKQKKRDKKKKENCTTTTNNMDNDDKETPRIITSRR